MTVCAEWATRLMNSICTVKVRWEEVKHLQFHLSSDGRHKTHQGSLFRTVSHGQEEAYACLFDSQSLDTASLKTVILFHFEWRVVSLCVVLFYQNLLACVSIFKGLDQDGDKDLMPSYSQEFGKSLESCFFFPSDRATEVVGCASRTAGFSMNSLDDSTQCQKMVRNNHHHFSQADLTSQTVQNPKKSIVKSC